MIMPFLSTLLRDITDTLKRFPLAVCCAIAYTAILLMLDRSPLLVDVKYWFSTSLLPVYLAISCIGCFWFISAQLIAESRGWARWKFYALALPVFVIIIVSVKGAFSTVNLYLGTGIFLLMFIAPFLKEREDSDHIWTFQYKVWLRLVFVVAASTTLYLGVAASLLSIKALFGIDFYSRIYIDLASIAVLFGSILAMAGIPKSFTDKEENCPKGLRVIICNIVIPLLAVYAVILYGYAAKILLMGSLPKGGVVYMVMAFALIGVISYLAIYPLYLQRERKYWFGRYFFLALIVPIGLLAVAITVRISEYGITEDRYTVIISLLWFVSLILFSLMKNNKMMKPAYLSLVALLLAGSFGPWSAVNLSTASQVKRLEVLLTKNQILSNNRITVSTSPIDPEDRKTIISIVSYLVQERKIENIKPWFAGQDLVSQRHILNEMGIYDSRQAAQLKHFDFRKPAYKIGITVKGYDYLLPELNFSTGPSTQNIVATTEDSIKFSATLDDKANMLHVKNLETQQAVSFNLREIIGSLEKQKSEDKKKPIQAFESENNQLKAKLIINYLYGKYENDVPVISSMNVMLAIKVKK